MARDALGNLALFALGGAMALVSFELAKSGDFGPGLQTAAKNLESSLGTVAGSVPGIGSGASGSYNTKNGVKTVAQMHAELDLAANSGKPGGHWSGDGKDPNDTANIVAGYAKVTGAPVTPV